MKLHEHQAKGLLAAQGVPVPQGRAAFSVDEAVAAARAVGFPAVVKAQIHAGGRGKGGGVKLARSLDEVESLARAMLGMRLVTHQTGPEGRIVRRLLVEQGMDMEGAREMYLAVLIDRQVGRPVVMGSSRGGVDIEEVAAKDPAAIVRTHVDPAAGFQPFQARKLALALGLSGQSFGKAVPFISSVYKAFVSYDAALVEINPLLVTRGGDWVALDAKVDLDDNALRRHPDLVLLRDLTEESPLEVEAGKHDLNYIKLEGGTIGCMVNGAGLAMATMDIIKLAGGSPANFLDVGGGANADQIRAAFRILLADKDVKVVLINIFGGILRCDVLAEGVIAAVKELDVRVPVVVRMKGNNEDLGRSMLAESGLDFRTGEGMAEAAQLAVAAGGGQA
jgi:succinyl-CoA synthetase beta subunit